MKSESRPMKGKKVEEPQKPIKGMKFSFTLLLSVFLLGILIQHIVKEMHDNQYGLTLTAMVVGLTVFVLVVVAGFSKNWQQLFATNRFAVPLILSLTFLAILGTLILQGEPDEVMHGAYGKTTLSWIRKLFLDDLFHSCGFSAVVGVGAGGLALTISRKRRLTLRYAGSLFAHVGLLLILGGAVVGNVWGEKGWLNMQKGQSVDRFFVSNKSDRLMEVPLGFSVRLDDFQLLHYRPDYRLMVFDVSGKTERLILTIDPSASEHEELQQFDVKIIGYWPDHQKQLSVEPLQDPKGDSVAALMLSLQGREQWLFDPGTGEEGQLNFDEERLLFFRDTERAEKSVEGLMNKIGSSPHWLEIGDQMIPLEIGSSYLLPGTELKIEALRAFSDFVLEGEGRSPKNRSDTPNNPAIELVVKDQADKEVGRSWLFAKFPDFNGLQGSVVSGIRYHYRGGSESRKVKAVVVGEARQWWSLDSENRISEKKNFNVGDTMKLGDGEVIVTAYYPFAKHWTQDITLSSEEKNPLARIRNKKNGQLFDLRPEEPMRLGDDRVLVLAPKGSNLVKDYLSTLSVLNEKGQTIMNQIVEVNAPLSYGGYVFYQSDYRPDNLNFSGFQVVRDPGLWIVYSGFVVNLIGVFLSLLFPAILKRKTVSSPSAFRGAA